MTITEIKENISHSDKLVISVICGVSETYITKLLNGSRQTKTKKAKQVVAELKSFARVNKRAKQGKEDLLHKAGSRQEDPQTEITKRIEKALAIIRSRQNQEA